MTVEPRSAGPDARRDAGLGRPPIRQRTTVGSDCAHTFAVFTARLGEWWPLVPSSVGRERIREVVLESESGGRVYEVWEDGSTADWGRIIDWDPPRRFSMTWNATRTPTIVELEFRSLGPLGRSRTYTLMVLRAGPNIADDQTPSIVWEHGKRNLTMMKAGQMPVICAVDDDTEMCGIGVFDLEPEQVRAWMDDDPGVRAGVFEYELHVTRSFPGSTLPT